MVNADLNRTKLGKNGKTRVAPVPRLTGPRTVPFFPGRR
ncbi:MAG: hypothetical protein AVDCRST_MAG56-6487 [uncultured Cytophagales bacterium]|uniref:Uncharacterized protein n=1 Tax=uncultured Cytophagales bacterium TaxID=158755 RepID=A0A6J4KK65_9SPHI|nr:MAG: hypothetical protein AVDCRST_MAG56-6487 [uncultured Cytophagales bacterium]